MNENTVIITRTLDAREMERLREKLRELWPGDEWAIMHGRMLRDVGDLRAAAGIGPSEWKDATMTPVPRFEQ